MSLWDIATDLEDVSVGLHQLQNLLQIYYEQIEKEIKCVGKHHATSYFIDRYDLLRSLLEVMQSHTRDTAECLQKRIDSIYAAGKEEERGASA